MYTCIEEIYMHGNRISACTYTAVRIRLTQYSMLKQLPLIMDRGICTYIWGMIDVATCTFGIMGLAL